MAFFPSCLCSLVLFAASVSLTQGLPACLTPNSYSEACNYRGHTPQSCHTGFCCYVCPPSACSANTFYGTGYYYYTNYFCRSAAHSGALPLCGSPMPVYTNGYTRTSVSGSTRNGLSSASTGSSYVFRLPYTPAVMNVDTGMLVRNFRLTKGSAPTVTCYSPSDAGNVKLAAGPFYSAAGARLNSQLSPSSVSGSTYKESSFYLSSAAEKDRTGTYMCSYAGTGNTAYLSPVGLVYKGQTRFDTLALERSTFRISKGKPLALSIKAKAQSIKWQRDGSQQSTGSTLTRSNVSCSDAGLYYVLDDLYDTAYTLSTQAMFRLLVLDDARNTSCNGGIKRDGKCICPPGLYGSDCTQACDSLKFGQKCGYSLGNSLNSLQGAALCLPDPYGCECVPGFSGPSCDQPCATGRFGLDCSKQCRCYNGDSECSSYNGRCASGTCVTGYRGDNCQQECAGRSYGQSCSYTCHCADVRQCHHVNGPQENCTCSSRWMGKFCDIAFVDPVATLNTSRVNPDERPPIQCSLTGTPQPTTADVTITADGTVLQSRILQTSPLLLEATDAPILPAGHVMNVSCCITTAAGSDCDRTEIRAYDLLQLKNFPLISEVTETLIKLRFPAWRPNVDLGEGPVERYRLCYRKSGSKTGSWTHGQETNINCNSCVLQAEKLKPQTMYDLAVSVRRPGQGGWGKCSPVVAELTKSVDPNKSIVENSLSVLLQDVQYLKTQLENLRAAKSDTDKALYAMRQDIQALEAQSAIRDGRLSTLLKDILDVKAQCTCCSSSSSYYPTSTTLAVTSQTSITTTAAKPSTTSKSVFADCPTLYNSGETKDGKYNIQGDGVATSFPAWCQKGWLVIQRRSDGKTSFNRTFAEYESGFGSPLSDHWLGLSTIRNLTRAKPHQLRIEVLLDDASGDKEMKYIDFSTFSLSSDYRLHFKENSTNFPFGLQELKKQLNAPFSAFDKDLDRNGTANCALESKGGWWLAADCQNANLNAARFADCSAANPVCGMLGAVVKATTMLIRPVGA